MHPDLSHASATEREGGKMKTLVSLMFVAVWTSPLSGQDTTRAASDSAMATATTLYRNPKRALILGSVIPGAGHIYAGEYVNGFLTYELTVGTIGGGVLVFIVNKCVFRWTNCDPGPEWPHQLLGVAMVGTGLWKWISSARDAPHAAERANARHAKAIQATPIIQPPVGLHSGWKVGAVVNW
jgi:hypothetical protein